MKTFKKTCLLLSLIAFALSAQAQFRYGLKLGYTSTKTYFKSSLLNEGMSSRSGFTGGITGEFMFPASHVGLDASVLYSQRGTGLDIYETDKTGTVVDKIKNNRDYLELPVNFKWKFDLFDDTVLPYVFSGPEFDICLTKDSNFVDNQVFNISWNFGIGVELISKIQITGSYGIDLTKSATISDVEGKDRYWTLSAAYLF